MSVGIAVISWIVVIVFSYLLGSASTSVIVSRICEGIDIRNYGSGNAGTTNVLRILGTKAAVVVLLGDALKGFAAAFLGYLLCGEMGAWVGGFLGIIGHMFPVFFQFRGGKGMATAMGMMFVIDWRFCLLLVSTFIIIIVITHIVSLSSVLCAGTFPITTYIYFHGDIFKTSIALLVGIFIVYKHKANIKRILDGTESRISFKRRNGENKNV